MNSAAIDNIDYGAHACAMVLPHDMTIEQWTQFTASLISLEEAIPFFIGDGLVYGFDRFGEEYAQVFAELQDQKQPKTLLKYQWICERVSIPLRLDIEATYRTAMDRQTDDLPEPSLPRISHYELVAKFEERVQRSFLREATTKGLSVRALRENVKHYKEELKKRGDAPTTLIPSTTSRTLKFNGDDEVGQEVVETLATIGDNLPNGSIISSVEITVRVNYDKEVA